MNNTILVIEDNLLFLKNIHTLLDLSNYKVLTAENGTRGVEKAKREKPDLIICDIMMPELDGYSVLHMLGKDPETSSIPFIFLTSKTKRNDFRKGMNHGADDYLTKPFEDMDLLKTIEKRLIKSKNNKKSELSIEKKSLFNDSHGLEMLMKLLEDKKTRSLKKRENLFSSGDFSSGVYYVRKGKIKTFVRNTDGKEFVTGLHKKGDFIGCSSIIEKKDYTDSAIALEDSEIVKIPKEDFLKLYNENIHVVKYFIKIMSENILHKEQQLLNMAYSSARKRISEALCELSDKYKEESEGFFSIAIARDDLAAIVGTSKETITRALSEFKEEGLLNIKGSKITFIDKEGLNNVKW